MAKDVKQNAGGGNQSASSQAVHPNDTALGKSVHQAQLNHADMSKPGAFSKANRVYTGIVQKANSQLNNYRQVYYQGQRDQKQSAKYNEIIDYLNSGNLTSAQTKSYLDEATALSKESNGYELTGYDEKTGKGIFSDKPWSSTWLDLANYLQNEGLAASYQSELGDIDKQRSNIAFLKSNAENIVKSTSTAMINAGYLDVNGSAIEGVSGEDYSRKSNRKDFWTGKIKDYDLQDSELSTKRAALVEEMFGALAPEEVKAARQALEENNYGDPTLIGADGAWIPNGNGRVKVDDQKLVDDFMKSLGETTQYYNHEDRFLGGIESGAEGVASSVVGAYGTVRKLGENISAEQELNLYATDPTQMATEEEIKAKEAEREAKALYDATHRDKIGGIVIPTQQEIADLSARAQREAFDGISAMPGTATAIMQENASVWGKTAETEQKAADEINAQIKSFTGTGEVDVAELARLKKEAKEHEKNAKDARDIAKQYGGGRASLSYIIRNGTTEEITHVIDQISWELGDKANEELRKATQNAGPIERTLVHMTKTGVEMGFDATIGAITGTGGLPAMFVRVFGQASQEANRAGASLPRQVLYGVTVAGIELFTEKIADFGGGLIYGKSFTGDFAKRLIHNLNLSPVWEKVCYAASDALGEGFEEGLSDILGGIAEMIIRRNPDKGFWEDLYGLTAESCADIWYDMLLGSLMGLVGAGGGAITGQYNADLAEQYNADVARDEEITGAIEDERDTRLENTAKIQGENFDPTKINEMMDARLMEAAENQSPATKIAQKLQALKVKAASGKELSPEEYLTKKEADIAVASGWIDRKDRSNYTLEKAPPSVRSKLSDTVGGVVSKLGKGSRYKGENRHDTVTGIYAENMDTLDYGYKGDPNIDYRDSTGITAEEADAIAEAESIAVADAANEEGMPKGGDAVSGDLSQYNQEGLNKFWKDKKLTSGQYAEAMVKNGFWSEQMARSFLSTVKHEISGSSAEERNRDNGKVEGKPISEEGKPVAKKDLPDTPETTKSETERILKEIDENDSHVEEDHRPTGGGVIYWTKSRNTQPIAKIWEKQKARLDSGKKMSRDAEFEVYTDDTGRNLSLEEAALAEENGETVHRWRAIDGTVVDEMVKATSEHPFVVGGRFGTDYKFFIFDGTRLRIVKSTENLKTGEIKVTSDDLLPANKFETAAVYLSQCLSNQFTGKSAYYIWSGGHNIDGNQINSDKYLRFITDTNAMEGNTNEQNAETESVNQGNLEARSERSAKTHGIFDPAGAGSNTEVSSRFASRAPKFIGERSKELSAAWEENARYVEDEYGGTVVSDSEAISEISEAERTFKETIEDVFGIPITYYRGNENTPLGFVNGEISDSGLFIKLGSVDVTTTIFHELIHRQWGKNGFGISRREVVTRALIDAKVSLSEATDLVNATLLTWGSHYLELDSVDTWRNMSDKERLDMINRWSYTDREALVEALYEELGNVIATKDEGIFGSYSSLQDACGEMQYALVKNGIFTDEEMDAVMNAGRKYEEDSTGYRPGVDYDEETAEILNPDAFKDATVAGGMEAPATGEEAVKPQETAPEQSIEQDASAELDQLKAENEELKRQLAELKGEPEPPAPAPDPRTPGRTKESQSKENLETRGEKTTTKEQARSLDERLNTGDGTFVSKTNLERTEMANKLLTGVDEVDTTRRVNEQYDRLLSKEKGSWTDDDIVIAQKLMGDMLKSARDYQSSLGHRMTREAYRRLSERYSALALRHTTEKSIPGQKLQAHYVWSAADEVLNRATQMFLGFSADGRFAGQSVNATNAKIYAGIEDAVGRVQKAVKENDAQALAQICKDVSDIRGIKRMFGPAAEWVSNLENDILNSIVGQENAVQALETLAYGNLNAICDDVQPYKKLNAAKTIRVMNMLSNMSTIINNLVNNAASGMTSTNGLAQASSMVASKAFANIIGQPVLTKAQKGWVFNRDIRNAEIEALKMATLVQMYGVNSEDGRLELNGDKGLFNPNANTFEQTMALYKFFIGMGVEATDQVKAAGLRKAMDVGIDKSLAKGEITEQQAETMRKEAAHEVQRLLYKDDNKLTAFVQTARNFLNKAHIGNKETGTIGLGDITMAFAKIPANVVRARLYATPEGCLLQLAQYTYGVNKAKRMHSEVLARQIMEKYATEKANLNKALDDAYELDSRTVGKDEKTRRINEVKGKLKALDSKCWSEAREQCSGGVYNRLVKERNNYSQDLEFDSAIRRCGYHEATEMTQFEAATYSRKIGKAATSAGMVALGAILRSLGALRDFDQEPDEELRKMYKQKGYTGLMLNWSAMFRPDHEWKDGDHIVSAEFLEVVAMPLAIGAMAQEAAMNEEAGGGKKLWAATKKGTWDGLGKSFEAIGDLPGMADAMNMYNAVTNEFNKDSRAKGLRVINSGIEYLANTVPSFLIPNAVTQLGAGLDNTVRDVYTTDNILQRAGYIVANKVPKLRKVIPASVDMWGDERKYGENKFWGVINKTILPGDRFVYHENKYETEIIRLTSAGYSGATPKISVSGSFEVDNETYTLDADEKRTFKENRNKEQAEFFKAFIDSDTYKKLTDDQKVEVLKRLKTEAERDARQAMLLSRGLDVEVTRDKWETELELDDQIIFLGAKQMAMANWDSETNSVANMSGMDAFIRKEYGHLSQPIKDLLDNSMSQLDNMYTAYKEAGIDSRMWSKAYDIYRNYNTEEGRDAVEGGWKDWEAGQMYTSIQKATGATDKQMDWFEGEHGLHLVRTEQVYPDKYLELTDVAGWSRESATALSKATSELKPGHGNKEVSYKQRLTAITKIPNVSDDEMWEAFYLYLPSSYTKIKSGMTDLRKKDYTLEEALKKYNTGKGSLYWVD